MAHEPPSNKQGPGYYKRGNADTWDFIREQGLNFHLGNAIKYIVRAGYKDDKRKDLEKAIHYLQNELDHTPTASSTISDFIWDHQLEEQADKGYAEEPYCGGV